MTRRLLGTTAAFGAAGALIVAGAVVEGLWSKRWCCAEAEMPATRMSLMIPAALGDWEREQGPTCIGTCPEAVEWTFRRQRPERTVRVCLVLGDRRTLASHSPQACYPDLSLRLQGSPAILRLETNQIQAEFWTAAFWREEPVGRRRLAAAWTCRAGGRWNTADSGSAGGPLVKLYLFAEEPTAQPAEGERLLDLARALLPELEEALAPKPAEASTTNHESPPSN